MVARGEERFVRPDLPPHFLLLDAEGPREDVVFGPFPSAELIFEEDGAMVLYEYGSLPVRLGVVRQEGSVLHLYPSGRVRVVTVGETGQAATTMSAK